MLQELQEPGYVAFAFSLSALALIGVRVFARRLEATNQIIGTLLVIAISLYAANWFVYAISVFIVATLVTELAFLEKLAALAWNRKEYWQFLSGTASAEDVKDKVRTELATELQDSAEAEPNEAEAIDGAELDEVRADVEADEQPRASINPNELLQNAMQFEKMVLNAIEAGGVPFTFKRLNREVRIVSGSRGYIIDGILETEQVHYLLEIKFFSQPSSLIDAVAQIKSYVKAYEEYLRERGIKAAVQPLVIVPFALNVLNSFYGIPIVKFDSDTGTFSNFKTTYTVDEFDDFGISSEDHLKAEIIRFFKAYPNLAFSPLRIQRWGARQPGHELLRFFKVADIRRQLTYLVDEGILETKVSTKGNTLYAMRSSSSDV